MSQMKPLYCYSSTSDSLMALIPYSNVFLSSTLSLRASGNSLSIKSLSGLGIVLGSTSLWLFFDSCWAPTMVTMEARVTMVSSTSTQSLSLADTASWAYPGGLIAWKSASAFSSSSPPHHKIPRHLKVFTLILFSSHSGSSFSKLYSGVPSLNCPYQEVVLKSSSRSWSVRWSLPLPWTWPMNADTCILWKGNIFSYLFSGFVIFVWSSPINSCTPLICSSVWTYPFTHLQPIIIINLFIIKATN